jgi:hypothetical protein
MVRYLSSLDSYIHYAYQLVELTPSTHYSVRVFIVHHFPHSAITRKYIKSV